jgi:hypothetical protein
MSKYLYLGLGAFLFALGYTIGYAADLGGFYTTPTLPPSIEFPFDGEAMAGAQNEMLLQILQPADDSLLCETLTGECQDMDADYTDVPESPNHPDALTVRMLNRMGVEHSIAIL